MYIGIYSLQSVNPAVNNTYLSTISNKDDNQFSTITWTQVVIQYLGTTNLVFGF